MIPSNVNSKEELLKYLIPLGFYIRHESDEDFYLYKNTKMSIGLRFNSPQYELFMYYIANQPMYESDDYYGYIECINFFNTTFKGEFRKLKVKNILNDKGYRGEP